LNLDIVEASDGIQVFKNPMGPLDVSTSNSSFGSAYELGEAQRKQFLRGASTTTMESNESGSGVLSFGVYRGGQDYSMLMGDSPLLTSPNKNRRSSISCDRTYLFQDVILNGSGLNMPLWSEMQFWEDAFVDAVAQERDILGKHQESIN
ncbi:hypothetical protein Ciccas_011475, partial [Cichlidogyrus casuarinus]